MGNKPVHAFHAVSSDQCNHQRRDLTCLEGKNQYIRRRIGAKTGSNLQADLHPDRSDRNDVPIDYLGAMSIRFEDVPADNRLHKNSRLNGPLSHQFQPKAVRYRRGSPRSYVFTSSFLLLRQIALATGNTGIWRRSLASTGRCRSYNAITSTDVGFGM